MYNEIESMGVKPTGPSEVVDTFALDASLFGLALVLVIIHLVIMSRQIGNAPDVHCGKFLLNSVGLFSAATMLIVISKTF